MIHSVFIAIIIFSSSFFTALVVVIVVEKSRSLVFAVESLLTKTAAEIRLSFVWMLLKRIIGSRTNFHLRSIDLHGSNESGRSSNNNNNNLLCVNNNNNGATVVRAAKRR